MDTRSIIEGIAAHDPRIIARAISIIEEDNERSYEIIRAIYGMTGHAHILGITGPPGVGKSTMIGILSRKLTEMGKKVSILAVDASSPFSGGTILGNRIRMQDTLSKYGIYMRSVSNRGMTGGLSRSTWNMVKILDAAGNDFIIIETVGAGQSDIDIVYLADTVIVTLAPGLGDSIQAIKSGMMEIGDIFVINKMDREDSFFALKDIMDNVYERNGWMPRVVGTNSLKGEGYGELIRAIEEHRVFTEKNDGKKKIRYREEVRLALSRIIDRSVWREFGRFLENGEIDGYYDEHVDPNTVAMEIFRENSAFAHSHSVEGRVES
ncbi:methylmalonyl Co-A mutase-associated GTPase MeaB [Thermoplasma sp. Kam2015]|uniref:methylmalonyl Co-A mutase-associated GTPase MeaB n=1 Tax=Thermoplasma sp. Kam2015 TaxID=2094122 RepID=UPI000D9E2B28|nr:methylmalonyl Co-A mutase-associated GTPase MeaB [Thermoplasma sp. Kam2015]PYB68734.1 methylmalonyl Co-A mutase-associated GTPase MeaB [Thermoplasma sp. Kam2015]